VTFHFSVKIAGNEDLLAGFDRVVIASGARYPFLLGPIAKTLLNAGLARWPGFSRLFASARFRNWLYCTARRETGSALRRLRNGQQIVMVIGDACRAGKSGDAVASAFDAALLGMHARTKPDFRDRPGA
jgi:hypothetical protein